MSAQVVHLADYRAERLRADFIRQLADELEGQTITPADVAAYYEANGWANAEDLSAALRLLGKESE